MEFKVGDEVEITKRSHFHPSINIGDRGLITAVNEASYSLQVGNKHQVSLFVWDALKLVNREIKLSGFAKFIKRVDSLET